MNGKQLKNSILQWAIQGKLVPQDPNDEPASVLLERIRAEKKRLIKEGKIKKDKNESIIYRGDDNSYYEKFADGTVKCIDEEIPFDEPPGWVWARLKGIVYNHGQITPIHSFSYIDIGSIDNKELCLNKMETIIEAPNAPSRARRIVQKGDILYSTVRPYLHNMCVVDRDFSAMPIASTGLAVMACHSGLNNHYLFLYLQSPQFDQYANSGDNAKGVAYPAINDEKLYNALIPLPPKEEQRRICACYDNLLPFLRSYNRTQSELDLINDSINKKLRKSILQEAIQGRLVLQDPDDEPASVLIERIRLEKQRLLKEGKLKRKDTLDSVIYKGEDNKYYEKQGIALSDISDEIPFEIPDSWQWCRLGSVILLQSGQDLTPDRYANTPTGIPYITGASNFLKGELTINRWTTSPTSISHDGDLLITCKGTVGTIAYNNTGHDIHIARQIMAIRPLLVNIRYIEKYLEFSSASLEKAAHSIIPGISRDTLLSALIPIPPLSEQIRIIRKIDEITKYLQ